MIPTRRFFMDGSRVMVGDLDGSVHELDRPARWRKRLLRHLRSRAVVPRWAYVDVPVIDGWATLPDGRVVASSAAVVRVPVLS